MTETVNGRYRLDRQVSTGGMSSVYAATDLTLSRRVALKMIALPGNPAAQAPFLELFHHETRLLATIEHPSITSIYDMGLLANGSPYLVMEWIEGHDLSSILLNSGPLPVRTALLVARQIADALGVIHAAGYVHRDIKPANILILDSTAAAPYTVKLLDFGLTEKFSEETGLTKGGSFLGSPNYMSPEQLQTKPLNATSDIWQLGVTLFEMLTGSTPFESSETLETFRAILEGNVKMPPNTNLPRSVVALLMRFMAKDPAARPADGKSALQEIREAEKDLTSEIGPYGANTRESSGKTRPRDSLTPAREDRSTGTPRTSLILVAVASGCSIAVLGELVVVVHGQTHRAWGPWFGISFGVFLAGMGVCFGRAIWLWLASRRNALSDQAQNILSGARSRDRLSQTLAIQVDDIAARCKLVDEKFLAMTMAVMVDEYGASTTFDDRQKALMNAVTLLEKLMAKLSPWYVRNDKLIALVVTSVGVVSGVITILQNVSKLMKGQ